MFNTYQEIYTQRGGSYHRAMQEMPGARRREFERLMETAQLPDEPLRVLDIPSGGGYLKPYLPEAVRVVSVDPAEPFLHAGTHEKEEAFVCAEHDDLPFTNDSFDALLSLAGLHHLDDHPTVFREWHRVLQPGGLLAVGDASADSPTSRFLDSVVDAHNSMGHRGNYFTPDIGDVLNGCGFSMVSVEESFYTWDFTDLAEMLRFCRILFCLDRNPSDETLLQGIRETVGYVEDDNGAHLNWFLTFIRATA